MEDTLLQCNYFVMGVRGVFGIFAVVAVVTVAAVYLQMGGAEDVSFQAWKAEHGFKWEQTEDIYRRIIFQMNVKAINQHNSDRSQTYKQGVNQFTAMTKQQFAAKYLNNLFYQYRNIHPNVQIVAPIPNDIDWSTKISIPVKNQPSYCGAYAFHATILIQADYLALKNTQIPTLSMQQMIDCSRPYGCMGCNGCFPQAVLKYVKDHPLCTEQQYPYTGRDQACKNITGSYKISGYVSYNSCSALQTGIYKQPIDVAVDATNWSTYKSGIFSNCKTSLNHECLLVGVVGGAWKLQNTWGTSWGQSGYIRLAGGNTCGVCTAANSVTF